MPFNNIVGRADVAGIIPVEYSNELLNMLEERSHLLQLGRGLRRMSVKEKRLPVISALSTAYFLNGDTDLVQTSEVNWVDKVITAEDLAVLIPIPKNVLSDASIPLWDEIRPDLVTALGVAIDNAQLYGTNKPATWLGAIATDAVAAGNSVNLGSGSDLYDEILSEDGVFSKVEVDGYGVSGSIAHLSMKGRLRGTRTSDGEPIFTTDPRGPSRYMLDGAPIYFPTNGSGNVLYPLVAGDWSQLVYSLRQDMEFEVFTQGVVQDSTGAITYNLMQQRMAAVMVVMRLGFQLPNPVNRVNSNAATRYPFAVLASG